MISTSGFKSHSIIHRMQDRELCFSNVASNQWTLSLIDHYLEHSKTFNYHDLMGHFGCVNAAEFSPDCKYLASGGDDRRVLFWKIWDAIQKPDYTPFEMKHRHGSNIFCLSFDLGQERIYSGGNDETLVMHNITTGEMIEVLTHLDDVYSISVNPSNNNILASASNEINIWDLRGRKPFRLASGAGTYHSVMYNPTQCNLLVTSGSHEGVDLYDVRQTKERLFRFFPTNILHDQSNMCARFNQSGTKLISLSHKGSPVLYDIRSPYPQVQFDADGFFDGCTLKNCTFAGENDQFVICCSDNFYVYLWKIPEFVLDSGNSRNPLKQNLVHIVDEPMQTLYGHRSIVNNCRFNPKNGMILSTGIEKMIRLWSPIIDFPQNNTINSQEPKFSRALSTYTDFIYLQPNSEENLTTAEDVRLIAYFDSVIDRDLANSSSNSSSEGIFSYFHNSTDNQKPFSATSQHSDPYSEVTVTSDSDEMFAVQKRFDFNNSKVEFEKFDLQDHLDLVFAKRVHARYLNSALSSIIHQIEAHAESFKKMIDLAKPSERNQGCPRVANNLFAILRFKKRQLNDYHDLLQAIKLKKQYKLLFKACQMVNALYNHMKNQSLFSKKKIYCCFNIVNFALFKNFFSSDSDIEISIRKQSTFIFHERKVYDKKLCSILRNVCKKTLRLLEFLIELRAQPLPEDQLNVRYSDSDLNSLMSESDSSTSSAYHNLINSPAIEDLELNSDATEDDADDEQSIPNLEKSEPVSKKDSDTSSTSSDLEDMDEEKPSIEEPLMVESDTTPPGMDSVPGTSSSTENPGQSSTGNGKIQFKKSDFLKRNYKTRSQSGKKKKSGENKRQRKS